MCGKDGERWAVRTNTRKAMQIMDGVHNKKCMGSKIKIMVRRPVIAKTMIIRMLKRILLAMKGNVKLFDC